MIVTGEMAEKVIDRFHQIDDGTMVEDMQRALQEFVNEHCNGALLREWLAEQFGVLPTHIWTEDRVVKPLGARIDGLVDVVLKQEQRLNGQLDAIDKRHERILEALPDVSPGGEPLLTQGAANAYGQREYDRGVADGRASVTNLPPDVDRIRKAEFDRGVAQARAEDRPSFQQWSAEQFDRGVAEGRLATEKIGFEKGRKIGQSEREAELLDQGWTPPGAVEGVRHELNAYEVWRDALTAAGSQRNRRELEKDNVLADAVWFWDRLIAGPPGLKGEYLRPMDESSAQIVEPLGTVLKNDDGTDDTELDPADQAIEMRAAADPADIGDRTVPQDPNDPTSAY